MADYESYVLILSLIVFFMLAIMSVVCVSVIAHLQLKLITNGVEDERLLDEFAEKRDNKKKIIISKILDYAFSGIVCLVFAFLFFSSLSIDSKQDNKVGDVPVYRVVRTGSMAEKNEKNTYLVENGLDDQILAFDLILTEKLPGEMELELYDIVVYEVDGMLIVHRIVEIEEPNASHPDCRHFRLQGDAVEAADRFPVTYDQMKAIYRGQRIPFVGSFILFMQSPAGWMCALFVLLAMIATPILELLFAYKKKKRIEDHYWRVYWGL